MLITDLRSISLSDITNSFNTAFSDYIIKFSATEEYLQARWEAAGVNFELSFGAFIDKKLAGFIIHGIGNWNGLKTAFNVGTGVIPEHRGKKVVKKLYDHALPILKSHGIKQCRLEVIQNNEKAVKAYQRIGFKKERELLCFTYKGNKSQHEISPVKQFQFKIKNNVVNIDWNILKKFWDFEPSWENSISCLIRKFENYQFFRLFKDDLLIGYAIINPKTGNIPQFALKKKERGKGYAKCLFRKLSSISNQLIVINVDKQSQDTVDFLRSFGFKEYISQFEMEKKLI